MRNEAFTRPGRIECPGDLRFEKRLAWVLVVLGCLKCLSLGGTEALQWESHSGYRTTAVEIQSEREVGFTRLKASETGIQFTNHLASQRAITNRNLLSGSGVAAGDVDGDDRCDLYFCRLEGKNALYRNLGNWRFEEVTAEAGVLCPDQDSMGASLADIDGDHDLDLLVNALDNGTRIFRNDGTGKFEEITDWAGVGSDKGATSLALADVDGDADLDLYACHFRPDTIKDKPGTRFQIRFVDGEPTVAKVNGRPTSTPALTNRFSLTSSGKVIEHGQVDALYLNDGNGRFKQVSWTEGRFLDSDGQPLQTPPRDWGLAVRFHDLNRDGAPDLYVCNDLFTPDRIWINNGEGTFRAIKRVALRQTSTFSMGVDMADLDRDQDVDIFVTDMLSRDHVKRHVQVVGRSLKVTPPGVMRNRPQQNRNTLQINRGDMTFGEAAFWAGVEASEWSWGPVFLDVDLDGFEDLLIPNGQLYAFQNADMDRRIEAATRQSGISSETMVALTKEFPKFVTRNLVFRNQGGARFVENGREWGFARKSISQGMALADLDNDGDQDVVVNAMLSSAGVYRNEAAKPRVAVRLKGKGDNSAGIGARVIVTGGPVRQSQEILAGGRYLSSDQPMRMFAAGGADNRLTIRVKWRSGRESLIRQALPNHIYEIGEPGSEARQSGSGEAGKLEEGKTGRSDDATSPEKGPYFRDVSQALDHRHKERPGKDFKQQPLLPYQLSRAGPGVAWHDLDGDGSDDLIVGASRGGKLAIYMNEGEGRFKRISVSPATDIAFRDQTTIIGWEPDPKTSAVIVGLAQYRLQRAEQPSARVFNLSKANVQSEIPQLSGVAGPIASADLDADGDLDAFIGGRAVPGEYPQPASSLLLENQSGEWVIQKEWKRMGHVNGAVFSDLTSDGYPELILACDWSPIRVFQNDNGELHERTRDLGLGELKGFWRGVTTGDFNEDGRLDIVATNWGENSRYEASSRRPLRVHYGDINDDGTVDCIESRYEPAMEKEVPLRGFLVASKALPFLNEQIDSFEQYASSSVEEIYTTRLKATEQAEITALSSMVLLNRGDHFTPRRLPMEAQLAPAFGVNVADMDGDGHDDLFLSQNLLATNPGMSRSDAGRGLWLRGDGSGDFKAVPGHVSGVKVYGEQRGSAVSDFNADGRVDLVVTQNGNRTRLFQNEQAARGLRVRLVASEQNPTGVGSVIRLKRNNGEWGPAREVHAGSGYWSQNSAVEVMGLAGWSTKIKVRWPGGKTTTKRLKPDAKEVVLSRNPSP